MQDFRNSSGMAEVSILLGYDATSLSNWFLTFDDKTSCHSRTETLRYVFFRAIQTICPVASMFVAQSVLNTTEFVSPTDHSGRYCLALIILTCIFGVFAFNLIEIHASVTFCSLKLQF